LRLSDYFDDRGSPRFRRLGLSFAAKQHDDIRDTFGSRMEGDFSSPGRREFISARAAHRASEAMEKDAIKTRERTQNLLQQLSNMDKHLVKDVCERQLQMIFCEIPQFSKYLPPGVQQPDLLPAEIHKEEEYKDRRAAERWNAYFGDKNWVEGGKMGWLLPRKEILQLNETLIVWSRATRGINYPLGMDRSTFVRFLLDCGLVDQEKVPLFWAVQIFDSVARPVRVCPADATWAMTAPAMFAVNRWTLMSVLDPIIRQHFDSSNSSGFMSWLTSAVQHLPSYIREETLERVLKTPVTDCNEEFNDAKVRGQNSPMPPSVDGVTHMSENEIPNMEVQVTGIGGAISGYNIPPWLQPPERPVSSLNTTRQTLTREWLVQSMLAEPEVLNIIMQYFPIFRKLHESYAPEGNMHYPKFMQFCLDFRLAPELVPCEFVKVLYESAQCTDALFLPPVQSESGQPVRRSASKETVSSTITRGSRRPRPVESIESHDGVGSRRARSRASGTGSLRQHLEENTDSMAAGETPIPDVPEVPASFGPNSFVEVIFKTTFNYLGFYGNIAQQSTGAYARAVWTISYLHFVFSHLHDSLQRRSTHGEPIPDLPLITALRAVPKQGWQWPAPIDPKSLSKPLLQRVVMPFASEGQHRAKRRRLNIHAPKLKPSMHTATSIRVLHFASKLKPMSNDTREDLAEEFATQRGSKLVREEDCKTSAATSVAHSHSSSDDDSHDPLLSIDSSPFSGPDPVAAARKLAGSGIGTVRKKSIDERPSSGPQPAPKSDTEAWPLEDLFQAEAGLPTISKERCTLCSENTLRCPWGNPGCRGCSIIDGLTLEMHPLSNLIKETPRGIKISKPKAVGRMPLVWRRDGFTPPPVKGASRESLRSRAGSSRATTARSWKERTGGIH